MKQYLETHIIIALTLLAVALSVGVGAFVADFNQRTIEHEIRSHLDEQAARMLAIAEVTDRNGADESTAAILKDCERRVEFESLLVKLGTLEKRDLLIAQNLFEGCGNFQRELKALMVEKLEREFEAYRDMLDLLRTLTEQDLDSYSETAWNEIVTHEKLRSELLTELTSIQGKIITELIGGASVSGVTVGDLVAEAQSIGQLLIVYDRRIDEARASIMQ